MGAGGGRRGPGGVGAEGTGAAGVRAVAWRPDGWKGPCPWRVSLCSQPAGLHPQPPPLPANVQKIMMY